VIKLGLHCPRRPLSPAGRRRRTYVLRPDRLSCLSCFRSFGHPGPLPSQVGSPKPQHFPEYPSPNAFSTPGLFSPHANFTAKRHFLSGWTRRANSAAPPYGPPLPYLDHEAWTLLYLHYPVCHISARLIKGYCLKHTCAAVV
jgi:hypothetical protein